MRRRILIAGNRLAPALNASEYCTSRSCFSAAAREANCRVPALSGFRIGLREMAVFAGFSFESCLHHSPSPMQPADLLRGPVTCRSLPRANRLWLERQGSIAVTAPGLSAKNAPSELLSDNGDDLLQGRDLVPQFDDDAIARFGIAIPRISSVTPRTAGAVVRAPP
jgi:hypothetical protein